MSTKKKTKPKKKSLSKNNEALDIAIEIANVMRKLEKKYGGEDGYIEHVALTGIVYMLKKKLGLANTKKMLKEALLKT